MLSWLICYLNYNGYYFDNPNYRFDNLECNYNGNYNQQQYYGISRRQRNRQSRDNNDTANVRNRQNQLEAEKRKALEEDHLKKGLQKKIEEGNKGYELLVKMGYEDGKGLGRNAEGMLEPLMLAKKPDRKGLGAPISEAQDLSKSQRKKRRRRETREAELKAQQVQKSKLQLAVVKSPSEPMSQHLQKAQAITPKPQNEAKQQLEKVVVKKLPQQVVTSDVKTAAKLTPSAKSASIPPKTVKDKFSVQDPCTPEFLNSLGQVFNSEIELMQLRLAAEASLNHLHADNDLIVAKIFIDSNPNVAEHVFEFIRTELVGWIGVYQLEGLATPIFHSITNNGSHITIICDDSYAFECLSRCIDDIVQMKTMESLKVIRLPPVTPLIYCFDAKYEGIATDADLFLSQLHLHKPKLHTDNWVVASQEVCPDERITYFIFLVDERSALALNFQYSRSFCICMQQVTFRSRGIVRD